MAAPEASAPASAESGAAGTPAPPRLSRIRLRATVAMRMLALIVALMGVAAVNYQSNATWAMIMVLIAMVGISALHARRALSGVCVLDASCPDAFAQDAAVATVRVFADGLGDACDIGVAIPAWSPEVSRIPCLRARSSAAIEIALSPLSRGVHRAALVRISTRFPFGLLEATREHPVDLRRVAYPRPLGGHGADGGPQLESGRQDSRDPLDAQGSDDFLGHRSWTPGDPERHVDWKALARGAPMLIKRFAGAGGPAVWIDWSRTDGNREARLSQMALWIIEADLAGASYGMRLPEHTVEPSRGEHHRRACLRLLAAEPRDAA
jgi:uncharacterized protein (DUF58 family)